MHPRSRVNTFSGESRGLGSFLHTVRDNWYVPLTITLAAVVVAVVYSLVAAERYEAEADVLVTAIPVTDDALAVGILRDPTSGVYTAGRLVKTPEVALAVRDKLGEPGLETDALLKSVEVEPIEQSDVLVIKAQARTAERAATLANTFAEVVIEQRGVAFQRELRATVDRLRARLVAIRGDKTAVGEELALQASLARLEPLLGAGDPTLRILNPAVAPVEAVWPRPVLSVALALAASLILGIAAVLAVDALSPTIKSEDDVPYPILARIPRSKPSRIREYLHGNVVTLPNDFWEAYRTLRAILFGRGDAVAAPKTVLVTSAIKGEGKTMTSVNLAATLAVTGKRVILVDADLRRPMIAKVFGLAPDAPGISSLLSNELAPEDILRAAPQRGSTLRLITAGPGGNVDHLEPKRLAELLARLENDADVIILDSPPLTEFADSHVLAEAVDAVVVVVRIGHSRKDRVRELRELFAQHGIVPAGAVVTTRRWAQGPLLRPPVGDEEEEARIQSVPLRAAGEPKV